jgi:hypothetical protein
MANMMTSISPSSTSFIYAAIFLAHLQMVFKYLAVDSIYKSLSCIQSILSKRQATDKQVYCNAGGVSPFKCVIKQISGGHEVGSLRIY